MRTRVARRRNQKVAVKLGELIGEQDVALRIHVNVVLPLAKARTNLLWLYNPGGLRLRRSGPSFKVSQSIALTTSWPEDEVVTTRALPSGMAAAPRLSASRSKVVK